MNPTLYNYIVGDVTVDLARVIERAMPGQILVGDFRGEMPTIDAPGGESRIVESADFVELAMRNVEQLAGIELSGERVDAIRCYLTGTKLASGEFTVRRITVNDKHGIARRVYNAKVNIYRHNAEPILLGIEDRSLGAGRPAGLRQRASAAAGARLTSRQCESCAHDVGAQRHERRIAVVGRRGGARPCASSRSGPRSASGDGPRRSDRRRASRCSRTRRPLTKQPFVLLKSISIQPSGVSRNRFWKRLT